MQTIKNPIFLWLRHTASYHVLTHSSIFSCAWAYGNEKEVGEGLKASGVPREEIHITSKLFELHHHPEHVELACKDTLKNLGVEYLDLYLLHWNVRCRLHLAFFFFGNGADVRSKRQINFQVDAPKGTVPQFDHAVKADNGKIKLDVPLADNVMPTWREMEKLVEKGLVKSIGISNFNIHRTEKLLKEAKIKPVAGMFRFFFIGAVM